MEVRKDETNFLLAMQGGMITHTHTPAIDAELIPYLYSFLEPWAKPGKPSLTGPTVSSPEVKCGSKTLEIFTRPNRSSRRTT